MAWSGGTFTRVGGVTHWVDDKNAAIPILASRHDTNDEDIAAGINACLTRDNQAKPTASFLPNADNSLDLGTLAARWRNLSAVTGLFGDGSAASPSLSLGNDPDTGAYRVAANQFGIAAGGLRAWSWTATQAFANDGTVAAPGLAFDSDVDTGFYHIGANDFGVSAGNLLVLEFFNNGGVAQALAGDGSAAKPSLSFSADTDTGIYRNTANSGALTAGGTTAAVWTVQGFGLNQDGSAAIPGFYFNNDTDTGFYRDTANQIGIALGGSTAGQFSQGSFTGTLTGCTTSPTSTIFYQQIGRHVFLRIGAVTGTSNANTLSITGVPAGIRPQSVTGLGRISRAVDSGTNLFSSEFTVNSSGVINFFTGGSSTGWTAAGTKGIPNDVEISYYML